jgi:hypothetical protein
MPTSNVTCVDALHHFQLLETLFLRLLALLHCADLPQERPRLLGICLQG